MATMQRTVDAFGPTLTFLTSLAEHEVWAVVRGVLAPGAAVPLHTHDDRETFTVVDGLLEAWDGDAWHVLGPDETFDVASGAPHALRNTSARDATLLITTTVRMARFLRAAGRPLELGRTPTDADLARFRDLAEAHGHWLGDADDNVRIGLRLGRPALRPANG